jgi:signal transduction histidine kinase
VRRHDRRGLQEDFQTLPKKDAGVAAAAYRHDVSRSRAFDIAVAAAVFALGQLEAWRGFGATHRQGPLWAQSLLYAVAALLLVFRRVRPLAVLGAIVAVYLVEFAMFGAPEGNTVGLAPLVAIYTAGRYLEPRRALVGLALGVILWAGWATLDPLNDSWAQRLDTVVWLTPWVIGWLLGALVRVTGMYREQRRVAGQQRASRAVAEERNRIARELHDVIGHSVSVMTVQAGAVRRRLTPDQAVERQALEAVESTGREALAEMRRMVGVLRQADGPAGGSAEPDREPPPSLAQVERLADKFRVAGLPVSVSVAGPSRELAPGLDLTAYRIVQEGLTNALRHASNPRSAEVVIAYQEGSLELVVRDDGSGSVSSDERPDGEAREMGSGLMGMRERVAVYRGSLVTRARPEGGFELVATLPLEPA